MKEVFKLGKLKHFVLLFVGLTLLMGLGAICISFYTTEKNDREEQGHPVSRNTEFYEEQVSEWLATLPSIDSFKISHQEYSPAKKKGFFRYSSGIQSEPVYYEVHFEMPRDFSLLRAIKVNKIENLYKSVIWEGSKIFYPN